MIPSKIWMKRRGRVEALIPRPFGQGRIPVDVSSRGYHSGEMICHRHQCIFVEVPRTGSTSIRALLGEPAVPHLNIWQIKQQIEGSSWFRSRLLSRAARLARTACAAITHDRPGVFESYFKFGFVRNPWDRAVSLFHRHCVAGVALEQSFDQFVEHLHFSSATCVHPVPHRYQLDWFVNPDGVVIMDFIGRFEHLARDWNSVASRIGLSGPLPHLNRSSSDPRHYTEYFTARTRNLIAERFSVDIEYFGYEFGK